MKYLISSNINYYLDTYPVLISSLIQASIPPEDIILVVGGADIVYDDIYVNEDNVNICFVKYNSFDLTALIFISHYLDKFESSHYFLLHDTCLVGPNFKNLAENFNEPDLIKTLREGISMNIGMYSKKCIEENISFLDTLKFYPKNYEELQKVKEVFVLNEDIIFKKYPNFCYNNNYIGTESDLLTVDDLQKHFPDQAYDSYFKKLKESKINRQIGYSNLLDFYKLQANSSWGKEWKIGI